MSRQRHQRLGELFAAARKLPAAEWSTFLSESCNDPELRAEVAALLKEDGSGSLDTAHVHRELGRAAAEAIGADRSSPESIADYRIIRLIGRGGMGAVYEAEQDDPRRRVALKVVRPGLFGREHRARFHHEAQVLGRLRHPGIAQIFEAGTDGEGEGGQPYFAMELVEGKPLLAYAEAAGLDTRARLELIALICDALHHAHQNGVIHRDLKPANILVEANGQPRILDFGVARSIDADIRTVTLQTELGQLVGTIPYMSPEQASGDPSALDTRSDIYALGVITYELLSGRLPYSVGDTMIHEAVRVIREEEPSRLGTVDRAYQGDIETIVSKTLEKEKERRYASAAELASDIRRYLKHEPIVANPPSASYRARKFVRRNPWAVAAATVSVLGLLIFAATMTVQAGRIASERDRANREAVVSKRVSEFLTGLFEVSDPDRAQGNSVTARELLDRGAAEIEAGLTEQPEVRAQLMATIGGVYYKLGLFPEAEPLYRASLDIREQTLGKAHSDTLGSMNNLGTLFMNQGRFTEAEPLYVVALAGRKRELGVEHPDTLTSINNLAILSRRLDRHDDAERLYREALAAQRRVLGSTHQDTARTMNNLSELYRIQGRISEAESFQIEALAARRQVLGTDHTETLSSMNNMAELFRMQGRFEDAGSMHRDSLEIKRRMFGDDNFDTAITVHNLACLDREMGNYNEARLGFEEAQRVFEESLGPLHPYVVENLVQYAELLRKAGDAAGAAQLEERAEKIRDQAKQGNEPKAG